MVSESSIKLNSNKAKRRASSSSEDKENKKPKTQANDAIPGQNERRDDSAEQSTVHGSGESKPEESIIPSVEKKEEPEESKKIPNSYPETWSQESDLVEETRDRRPTPGRNHAAVTDPKIRDNLTDDPDLITREIAKIDELIAKAPRRKGPKSAYLKDLEYRRETWADANDHFHPLYVCFAKGPNGSATYDDNGFELDYHKVAEWMKPKTVASLRPTSRKIKRQQARFDKQREEEKEMTTIFWEAGAAPRESDWMEYGDLIRDKVSKDLGIPWHKVWLKEFQDWESRGFQKAKRGEFAKMTDGERKRYLGLLSGASLRK